MKRSILLLVLWSVSCLSLAFIPHQGDFNIILSLTTVAFVAYFLINLLDVTRRNFSLFIAGAILIRLIVAFAFPHLSDDIYRFIWDGRMMHNGLHPLSDVPSTVVSMGKEGLGQNLFALLNSQNYYTVYPPVAQVIFYIATIAHTVKGSALIMSLVHAFADIGSLGLMKKILDRLELDKYNIFWYALNPLIIIELLANVHHESLMIFFLLLTFYSIILNKNILAGAFYAVSIGAKLLPLIFLFFLLKHLRFDKKFLVALMVSLSVLFVPFFIGIQFTDFMSSIDLYVGKFEFNGGLYYILRYLGKLITGYNLIRYLGPGLILLLVVLIIRWYRREPLADMKDLIRYSLFTFTAYLLFATTVHPWYLAVPIALSVFTKFRFAYIWSFLIMLTYINYSYGPYHENMWVVALEYIIIISLILWETQIISLQVPRKSN